MRKILIADYHPMVVEMMSAIARRVFAEAEIHTAAGLAEAQELMRIAGSIDLVLLDLGLPGCPGIDALIRFRQRFPAARVVVVSASEDRGVVLAALDAGARGYIPKTLMPEVIAAALRLVAAGGLFVPPQALVIHDTVAVSASGPLTERQLDVLKLMARGLANKEIATELRIAKETVKQHAKAVYSALGIAGRSQAARAAERRGIKLD